MTLKDIGTSCLDDTKNSNILDVKVKSYNECGYCSDPGNRIGLNIPWEIYSKWLYLSSQMGGKEWASVFTVKDDTITEFKIPKQEVSGTSVEFKEELGGNGIVHSHHDMGAFHSGQDEKHCRNLYEYSIVLSNGNGYVASKRIKLPCSAFGYLNVELTVTSIPSGIDLSKITEKTYRTGFGRKSDQPDLIPGNSAAGESFLDDSPCLKCTTLKCDECQFVISDEERCSYCESVKCKTCTFAIDNRINRTMPFCDYCEDSGFCESCEKLSQYIENYPEGKDQLEILAPLE